ncbi:hypothetical protein [Streptomyces sp. NPDC050121]|uniref:zinc finger domain-containing protein n=1 Tax=Streptomyces sp. NPDC050121 TaxID=3365601 RepID=UPI00378AFBFA
MAESARVRVVEGWIWDENVQPFLRVRAWYRNVACPNCGAAVGRPCRTAAGNSTDRHRARRDAAGPLPYHQWREEGVIPPELPAILKDSYAARLQFNIDQPLGDIVAIVRHVLANRLGLVDESALDRLDDAARALVLARGAVGSADLVTVLATQVARLARHIAGPYDPDTVFTDDELGPQGYVRTIGCASRRSHGVIHPWCSSGPLAPDETDFWRPISRCCGRAVPGRTDSTRCE